MIEVYIPVCNDEALNKIYGPSYTGAIYLPDGISGEELLKLSKQTEAERLECIKRGAHFSTKIN